MLEAALLCESLKNLLGIARVRCYGDTIDYTRPDALEEINKRSKSEWKAYATGSVFILRDKVEAGDVVVPLDKQEEMEQRLTSYGCPPKYVHRHEQFGTAHIHIERCPIRGREREFARIVSV